MKNTSRTYLYIASLVIILNNLAYVHLTTIRKSVMYRKPMTSAYVVVVTIDAPRSSCIIRSMQEAKGG